MKSWNFFRLSRDRQAWMPPWVTAGHTQEMLKCLDSRGHLYALDVDPIESAKTKERLEKLGFGEDILSIRLQNFADIDRVSEEAGLFDFVLADLGVSSMQIDNPDRGFSYKTEGPLDLRMNPEKGISAAERLKNITQEELQGMLLENADEPYAGEISREAVSRLKRGKTIDTTGELRQVVEDALAFLPGCGTQGGGQKVLSENLPGIEN